MTALLIDFLRGDIPDSKGRTYMSYIVASNGWWEDCHQHIQWAFPLPEPSKAQPSSPVANASFYEAVKADPVLQGRMLGMLGRYVQFLEMTVLWRRDRDHNHLRITRVLRCLTLCGMGDTAATFRDYCKASLSGLGVPETTFNYWDEALTENPRFLS